MKNLFNLLERFSKVLNKETLAKETIVKIVQEKAKVKLLPKQIFFKDGILEINSGAAAKSEINLKEEQIKTELKERHKIFISRVIYR
ncbi:MAG: hypothetical protein HYT69_01220 [Candidatus Zambryskibacteria bacterium]|nr:hypothetical protein [Candidatus Zambryskibacteria bacterium]